MLARRGGCARSVEGLTIEALHHGGLISHDPIACRIGRMTVAIRRIHASVIDVSPS